MNYAVEETKPDGRELLPVRRRVGRLFGGGLVVVGLGALVLAGPENEAARRASSVNREYKRFAALTRRFGKRSADWYVAYFYRPKDVVFDAPNSGRPDELTAVDNKTLGAFHKFLETVDSNGDGRYTASDDDFDPEYDEEVMEQWDRNQDGILSENDVAPRPMPSVVERIRHLQDILPEGEQLYRGWPAPRTTPEKAIESRIFEIQQRLRALPHGKTENREALTGELKSLLEQRAGMLAPRIERGKRLFTERCAGCHGQDGRGNGPASRFIGNALDGRGTLALPRDFTRGIFKFQRRDSGNMPADGDLFATIRRGMPGSAMPAWTELNDQQAWDLVDYIKDLVDQAYLAKFKKKFIPRFLSAASNAPIEPIPAAPSDSPELRRVGRYSFLLVQCYSCHGTSGKGDGVRGIQPDSEGRLLQARNYQATRLLKGGSTPREIYRTFTHGIGGTPMPSHFDDAMLIPNDMPMNFVVPVEVDGKYEFHLAPGITQGELKLIKEYVASLPSSDELAKMSSSERSRRAQYRRWALVYYIRSLMPSTAVQASRADRLSEASPRTASDGDEE